MNYLGTIDQWAEIDFSNELANPIYYANHLYINESLVTDINLTTATKIEDYAFYGYTGLTSLTIKNKVESIGICAFGNCSTLANIILECETISIGTSAFNSCYSLTELIIPNIINNIGEKSFIGCSGLLNIYYNGTLEEKIK